MDQTNPAIHQAIVGVAAALASRPDVPSGPVQFTINPGVGNASQSAFEKSAASTEARNKVAGTKAAAVAKRRAAAHARSVAAHKRAVAAHKRALARHAAVLRKRALGKAKAAAHKRVTAAKHRKKATAHGGSKSKAGSAASAQVRAQDAWSASWLG
jgi:hypothetical protein